MKKLKVFILLAVLISFNSHAQSWKQSSQRTILASSHDKNYYILILAGSDQKFRPIFSGSDACEPDNFPSHVFFNDKSISVTWECLTSSTVYYPRGIEDGTFILSELSSKPEFVITNEQQEHLATFSTDGFVEEFASLKESFPNHSL